MVKGNYIQARRLKMLECCHGHLDTKQLLTCQLCADIVHKKCTDTKICFMQGAQMTHSIRMSNGVEVNGMRLHDFVFQSNATRDDANVYVVNANT